jgi:acyl-CoA thioesterase YciA
MRSNEQHMILVTDGTFTYVSVDEQGHPHPIVLRA